MCIMGSEESLRVDSLFEQNSTVSVVGCGYYPFLVFGEIVFSWLWVILSSFVRLNKMFYMGGMIFG